MIRPAVVDGQRQGIGAVVEASDRAGRMLVAIGKAAEVDAPAESDQGSGTGDQDLDPDSILRPGHTDNLTVIRGIGPRTAEDLASMGISTFAALAGADAAVLAARLNGSSVAQVEGWIVQAQDMAAEES
jgi:predicted flap endonuclease-1-like 5' DNA nuclease